MEYRNQKKAHKDVETHPKPHPDNKQPEGEKAKEVQTSLGKNIPKRNKRGDEKNNWSPTPDANKENPRRSLKHPRRNQEGR